MWRAELLYVTFVSKSRASQLPQNLLEPQARRGEVLQMLWDHLEVSQKTLLCTPTVIHSLWDAEKPPTWLYARLLSSLCFCVRQPHFGTFYTF